MKLERCCNCHTSKAILKETWFFGKAIYICLECNHLKLSLKLRPVQDRFTTR